MKSAVSTFRLHYASGSTRRKLMSPWVFEVLEFLLALSMRATLLMVMTAALAMMVMGHWILAGVAFVSIPVVIIVCLESSEALCRLRQRIAP